MSFKQLGELGKLIESIKKELNDELQEGQSISIEEIFNLVKHICLDNHEYDSELVIDIANRFFTNILTFNGSFCIDNGKKCFRNWDEKFQLDEVNIKEIKVPKTKQKLEAHFQKLFNTPQPEQRSEEWYEYRKIRITASDTATAIDLNPYEPVEHFIVKKCKPELIPFIDGIFVFHGRKYEPIATLIYEHIKNTKVTEFGCLPSESHPFLGASPDGICSKSTLDNKFCDMLGTMLEIKCPFRRPIKTFGKIMGHICPYYYYCQVQQQLECCNLEVCDFWQCNIQEYQTRNDYLFDTNLKTKLTEGNRSKKINFDPKIMKGAMIQLLPKNFEPRFDEDKIEFLGHFLYPPRLDLTVQEYDNWCIETISTWQTKYPELAKKYYFDKIIYWKVPNAHNVSIKRDRKWFANILPILKETWEKVQYYRLHPEKISFLFNHGNKRKKFYKMKTSFHINNDLVDNKILFLDENICSNDNDECDFID